MLLVYFCEFVHVLGGEGEFLLLVLSRKDQQDYLFAIDRWRFDWGLPLGGQEGECPFVFLVGYLHAFLLEFDDLVFDVLAVEDVADVYAKGLGVLY